MKNEELCPCASGRTYGECCGPVIEGVKKAGTAEALMRARYSAYAVGDMKYLYASSGPKVRSEFDEETMRNWSTSATWEGLDVLETSEGGEGDEKGTVRFVAHYSANGKAMEHRETAYFEKIEGEWRFIDGVMEGSEPYRREAPKTGRNDPCPCGSGKKYKKCCGKAK